MKRKILLVVAASCLVSSVPAAIAAPVASSTATTGKRPAAWQYPKWYYYDQLGLKMWHKGEKKKALEQFKYAMRICETSQRIPPGGFDGRMKRMINDLIQHNMLVLAVEDEEPVRVGNIADPKQKMQAEAEERNRQLDKKITFLETMKKFVQRFIGKKSHLAVDMDMRINGIHVIQKQNDDYVMRVVTDQRTFTNIPVRESDRYSPNIGVKIPKWYRSTSSRFGNAGHEKERGNGEIYETGVSYKNGKRFDPTKENKDGAGWGTGMGQTDNTGLRTTGWGSEDSGPQKAKHGWGQERDDIDPNKKKAPKGWGETNTPKETAGSGWGNGSNWGEPVQDGASPNATPGATGTGTGGN